MLFHRGIEEWPEKIGKPVNCSGCNQTFDVCDCISVATSQQLEDGRIQVPLYLICGTCVLKRCEPVGRA